MPRDALAALRQELARHDRTIAAAVGDRLRVARRIGEAKRRAGLPIRNRAVERQVLGRWAERFQALGVPRDRAHAFARWLVEEAVRVQELAPGRAPGRRLRVAIVGGAGGMGRLLGDRLRAIGHRVVVVDPAARGRTLGALGVERDLATAARSADVVLVATPIAAAPQVYRTLQRAGSRAVVVDIFSVKAPVQAWIKRGRRAGLRVASVHPLFGPGARTVSGELVLLVDCGDRAATARTAELFEGLGVVLERVPLDLHDRWMADLQVVPRLAALSFLMAQRGSSAPARARSRATTPSFRRQFEVSERVLGEAPELSYAIQVLNPHARAATARYLTASRELARLLGRRDPSRYRARVARLRRSLRPLPAPRARRVRR